jgi:hypothetical protein
MRTLRKALDIWHNFETEVMLDSPQLVQNIYYTVIVSGGGSRICEDFVAKYADLTEFTTMYNIRCALRAWSRALRNRPRTLLYYLYNIYIYSGIVVHGEGGISAPYLYIIDKKESDWLPVTAAAALTYVRWRWRRGWRCIPTP